MRYVDGMAVRRLEGTERKLKKDAALGKLYEEQN